MKKSIFKKITALVMTLILVSSTLGVFAKSGDVMCYTKVTDIATYINHYAIQSYNINDRTFVCAEDLRNFGFNVEWNDLSRTLNITRNTENNNIDQYSIPYKANLSMLGQNDKPVYETDIKTLVNGVEAISFNIGGATVVDFESLSAFGPVEWNNDIRALKLWVEDGLEMCPFMQSLLELPKTYLYSADGRTIAVYPNEVEAYLNVGWYRSQQEAQNVANTERNKAEVSKFYVGQKVYFNGLVIFKYGTVRAIDASTGKVKVYWTRVEDGEGEPYTGLGGAMTGLYSEQWVSASSLSPMQ